MYMQFTCSCTGSCCAIMVIILDSRPSVLSYEPWLGSLCYALWQHTYFHSASLCLGVAMGTRQFNAGANPVIYLHSIQGEAEILLI